MTDQELDDILGAEAQIEPTPGFTATVMRAVHREATTPPPIRFPWVLALPGVMAWGLTLVLVFAIPWYSSSPPPAPAFRFRFDFSWVQSALDSLRHLQAGWIMLAVILTIACVSFPLRLIRGRYRN
ncbi:MAG TPA: hypothetical protein VK789_17365 [Bryobacteraceae bacterium]|jgi:hypothetical protein|nr:hypothetical protein [Bryobacteraceae bacterium]